MTAATEERAAVAVMPGFGIEADHPRNSDLLIQCIPGCRLRSAINGMKGTTDKHGNVVVPRDQAISMSGYPATPGMQLHVDPARLTYKIIDPLRDDFALLERLKKYLRDQTGMRPNDKLNGVETVEGTLDMHRMKSLCREMVWLVEAGEAKRVKGAMPTLEDVAELPGYFLLNPGARVQTTQPIYEKDWDDWVSRLSHSGM